MKKTHLIKLLLVAFCAAIVGSVSLHAHGCAGGHEEAQEQKKEKKYCLKSFMKDYDEDGNGVVTAAEFQASGLRKFSSLDKNSDGKIDSADHSGEMAKKEGECSSKKDSKDCDEKKSCDSEKSASKEKSECSGEKSSECSDKKDKPKEA